jgi:hypothetical protein
MDETNYIFKRPPEEYEILLTPVKDYIRQASTYISITNDIPIEEAINIINKVLKKQKIKNPIVTYNYRDENGKTETKQDKLTDYIKDTIAAGEVLVPSFTAYIHPSKKKSLHADFLDINIKLRKSDKHNAFKYKQLGDKEKTFYYNTLQKTRKVMNNSLSGAYCSPSTALYNPSAHYTLTSMTRSVASIGNAVSEYIIAGNKHFRTPDILLNYVNAIIANIHMNTVDIVVNKFNLYIPKPIEVLDALLYSSRNYWTDKEFEDRLLKYFYLLTPTQLCAVMYLNDLYHIKKYNEDFTRNMLTTLSSKVKTGSVDNLKDLNKAPEGINILTHHIWVDELRGKAIDYKELIDSDPELLLGLASTTKNIVDTLMQYKQFFRLFFASDIMPIDIAYIKDMLRDAIVLSDTDSTCGSYDHWVEWYFGHPQFSAEAVGLSAAVMTINTQAIDHNLKLFARNMNVDANLTELIKMKNEYYWPVFTATNVSKHYFADVMIQEGNVFAEPDLELKGVHLIASAVDQAIINKGLDIIKEINLKVSKGEKISLYNYAKQAADIERELIEKIRKGDISIFKKDKIKEEDSYKLDKDKSPYLHHMMWMEVFSEKYGNPGDPSYMVIKVPTELKSKKLTNEYLDSIKDVEIRDKLKNFLEKYDKETIGTFRPPVSLISTNGLPEEIIAAIDIKRIVMDNLNQIYLVLESIGFYRKKTLLISEMGY